MTLREFEIWELDFDYYLPAGRLVCDLIFVICYLFVCLRLEVAVFAAQVLLPRYTAGWFNTIFSYRSSVTYKNIVSRI
jgi:hypothetical protein